LSPNTISTSFSHRSICGFWVGFSAWIFANSSGEPVTQIVKWVQQKGCDLVAMSTHGHRFLADIFLGTTASRVQHSVRVPVLLLRAK
jgi:Universal stress protein family